MPGSNITAAAEIADDFIIGVAFATEGVFLHWGKPAALACMTLVAEVRREFREQLAKHDFRVH